MQAEKLLQEAREVAQKAAGEQKRNEGLAEVDDVLYERLYAIVSKQIGQLRVVLEVCAPSLSLHVDNIVPDSINHSFRVLRPKRRSECGFATKTQASWMTQNWSTERLGSAIYSRSEETIVQCLATCKRTRNVSCSHVFILFE
jgi:hypothetical protein